MHESNTQIDEFCTFYWIFPFLGVKSFSGFQDFSEFLPAPEVHPLDSLHPGWHCPGVPSRGSTKNILASFHKKIRGFRRVQNTTPIMQRLILYQWLHFTFIFFRSQSYMYIHDLSLSSSNKCFRQSIPVPTFQFNFKRCKFFIHLN